MNNNKVQFKDILNEMLETYTTKNNDYGDSFTKSLNEYGLTASLVRMEDKLNRLKTLTQNNNQQVKDESIQDTLLDLANYSAMTCMYLSNKTMSKTNNLKYPDGWYEMDLDRFLNRPYYVPNHIKVDLESSSYLKNGKRYVQVYIKSNSEIDNDYQIQVLNRSIGYVEKGVEFEFLAINKIDRGE